jgi:hypothetical protein
MSEPSQEALELAETLVNHQWGVSVHRLAVAFTAVRAQGERDGMWRCVAEMIRHARLDSTGDETKAAMHIVVNWLERILAHAVDEQEASDEQPAIRWPSR